MGDCAPCTATKSGEMKALRYFSTVGHNSVVTDQLHAGVPFDTTAIFDDKVADYKQCEFRQYVRGYLALRKQGTIGWECIRLELANRKPLHPMTFQEDGCQEGVYGYRTSLGCSDDFGPEGWTRLDGWLYTASDFPGIQHMRGTEYQIKLDFCLQIINKTSEGTSQPRLLSVRCSGALPEIHVDTSLACQPPVQPYWLPTSPDSGRIVVTEPKRLPTLQYDVRLILKYQTPTTIHICFIKPNGAPPITSFEIRLQDSAGAPFKVVSQVAGDPLPQGNSGSTTAQTSIELSENERLRLAAVSVVVRPDEVSFNAQDLQIF
jgi:hypothetical protein